MRRHDFEDEEAVLCDLFRIDDLALEIGEALLDQGCLDLLPLCGRQIKALKFIDVAPRGVPGVAGSDIRSMRGLTCCGPEAAIMPNSAMWLRIALINETR